MVHRPRVGTDRVRTGRVLDAGGGRGPQPGQRERRQRIRAIPHCWCRRGRTGAPSPARCPLRVAPAGTPRQIHLRACCNTVVMRYFLWCAVAPLAERHDTRKTSRARRQHSENSGERFSESLLIILYLMCSLLECFDQAKKKRRGLMKDLITDAINNSKGAASGASATGSVFSSTVPSVLDVRHRLMRSVSLKSPFVPILA
jgi:hypothetical protein